MVPQIHCRPRVLFACCFISCRHVKELRIGVVKNFTVQVIVENKAEDSAYATKFILKYPDKLDYVGSYQVLFLLKMTISVTLFHLTRIAPGKLPPVRYRLRTLSKRQRAYSNTTVLYRQCPINERMIFIVTNYECSCNRYQSHNLTRNRNTYSNAVIGLNPGVISKVG